MLRNQQFLRLYYDSFQWTASRPIIIARDVNVVKGKEKTCRKFGKREDLYPVSHANKGWSHRCDRNIHLRFAHDEDFTVLWDILTGDCTVLFLTSERKQPRRGPGEKGGEVEVRALCLCVDIDAQLRDASVRRASAQEPEGLCGPVTSRQRCTSFLWAPERVCSAIAELTTLAFYVHSL